MFTTGRLIFTLIFLVVFTLAMIWAYKKDLREVRKWFPRPWIVILMILAVFFVYFVLAKFL